MKLRIIYEGLAVSNLADGMIQQTTLWSTDQGYRYSTTTRKEFRPSGRSLQVKQSRHYSCHGRSIINTTTITSGRDRTKPPLV